MHDATSPMAAHIAVHPYMYIHPFFKHCKQDPNCTWSAPHRLALVPVRKHVYVNMQRCKILVLVSSRRLGALREHPPHTTQSTKQKLAHKLHAAHKQMHLSQNDQQQQLPSTFKACSHHIEQHTAPGIRAA